MASPKRWIVEVKNYSGVGWRRMSAITTRRKAEQLMGMLCEVGCFAPGEMRVVRYSESDTATAEDVVMAVFNE